MWKDLHLRMIYTNCNKVLEKGKSKEKSAWKERYHLYERFNKRVALGIGNCVLRTNCLAVTQADHCSEFRIPNCPITDDHVKAIFIELRTYSRELLVVLTLYHSFCAGTKSIYRLGLLFTQNGDFGGFLSVTDGSCAVGISKVKSLISGRCSYFNR